MSVANLNGTAIPDPGGSPATTAAPGVAIVSGVASPVLADPVSVEVSSDQLRALLDPADEDGLTRGSGDGVAIVFDPATSAAVSVGASGVVAALGDAAEISGSAIRGKIRTGSSFLTRYSDGIGLDTALRVLDLTAPDSQVTPSPDVTMSVVSAGSGQYDITVTQNAAQAQDGAGEARLLCFTPRDSAGNAVDLTTGSWSVTCELEIVSATPGASILVEIGLATRGGGSGASWQLHGFTTGTSALARSQTVGSSTNSTTADASIYRTRATFRTAGNTSGSYRLPGGKAFTYTSAGAISLENDFASAADASPGSVVVVVKVGTDAAGSLTDTVRVIARMGVFPVPT